ncbi:MAG: carbon-nitrogen hydrolase family protein [Balneolaceae bacterium]
MPKFKVAAIQLNSQPDLKTNLSMSERAVRKAAEMGAELAVLPENFAFMGNEWDKYLQGDKISKAVTAALPEWAEQSKIHIIAGGFPVRAASGKVYNRSVIVDPDGKVLAKYDKIHLFDVTLSTEETYRESDTVEAGAAQPVVCEIKLPNGDKQLKIGLSICYDLRFPELYRLLAAEGAELICIPSAFTRPTGKAHWEVLLRARAIENSLYVVAPAQTGQHSEQRKTYGHSYIIDPWGQVLSDAGTKPGVVISEIDTDKIREVRLKLPSLKHRVL